MMESSSMHEVCLHLSLVSYTRKDQMVARMVMRW